MRGKYRDTVAFYEMNGMTADDLHKAFLEVMKRLVDIGFHVHVVVTDGLSANINFFKRLGDGQLKSRVKNPINQDPLFLLCDPTHVFKNLYNNWQKKDREGNHGKFECPPLVLEENGDHTEFKYPLVVEQSCRLVSSADFRYEKPLVIFVQCTSTHTHLSFSHIRDLYRKEETELLKIAPKLTQKVIDPHGGQKTSVKLAAAVYNEKTVNGLRRCVAIA